MVGHAVWRGIASGDLIVVVVVAIAFGALATVARLFPLVRAGRRSTLAVERRLVPGPWRPGWKRARLDIVALVIGGLILAGNALAGGLRLSYLDTDHHAQALALSFYVMLAPIAIWLGGTLLSIRAGLAILTHLTAPDRPKPLSSWPGAATRWLGRRPARIAVALTLGTMAVAFGAEVVTFTATYRSAKQADSRAGSGQISDSRLRQTSPSRCRRSALTSRRRRRSASCRRRAGSDRKTIMAVDPRTYGEATIATPRIIDGSGVPGLAKDPNAVVVSEEIKASSSLAIGDTMPVTVFPDDLGQSRQLNLHVIGVFRSFPPDDPFSEMVMSSAALPAHVSPPDTYLARVAPGRSPEAVAAALRSPEMDQRYSVSTIGDRLAKDQRSLTALNLDGLSRLEAVAAGLIAAVGVGVLGEFSRARAAS